MPVRRRDELELRPCGGGGCVLTVQATVQTCARFLDLLKADMACCCGGRQQLEQKRPRKRRGSEVTSVVSRPPASSGGGGGDGSGSSLLPPPAARPSRPALTLSPGLTGPVAPAGAGSPTRTNRRKPRSFEAPATPKVAITVRKPRSFGAEGWLKVDLPVAGDAAEDQTWFRRVRNIVTAERAGGAAAPGELVPLYSGVYVGDRADAQNTEELHRLGITHVLNCATARETGTGAGFYAERSRSRAGAAPVVYMELGAADSEAADFIAPNLPVRPAAGASASCSICAAATSLHV